MSSLRCAVIGVGYLGRFHAQKYAAHPNAELVAVVDNNPENAQKVAEETNSQALTDYRDLLGNVDAVSIVVPTSLHYEVGKAFLETGAHVLMEKPITTTVEEADELIAIAKEKNVVLQVGHLERFNAAMLDLGDRLNDPRFIESHRLAPFKPRATDVNVVLDLMIHDIDIILDMVDSELTTISANGAKVLSESIDIANARLEFANGCVANVTASRVSLKTERKMRIFQEDNYVAIDFGNRALTMHRKGEKEMFPGIPEILSEQTSYENNDALNAEIVDFIAAIKEQRPALVTGEAGRRALAAAIAITEQLSK